ncbi:MAG: methyltransferase domain-containing protein [Chloroflexi bacterium]|nr:methyltransferase domain-containing protein [Chloroflexota bacterium]
MLKTNFFSTGSPFLNHPLLTPARTAAEVNFVLDHTNLTSEEIILDVGCGPGRHSIELTRRGYQVVGIDPSESMINAAVKRAAEADVLLKFIQVKGEVYSSASDIDAVICLFTTLGQIHDEGDFRHKNASHPLLNRIADVLRPGGILILEIPQKEWVIANLKKSENISDGVSYTDIKRVYDAEDSILNETFTLVSLKEKRNYFLRYYLYNLEEIHMLLEKAGFEVAQVYGDYQSSPLTEESPNMLIVSRLVGKIW